MENINFFNKFFSCLSTILLVFLISLFLPHIYVMAAGPNTVEVNAVIQSAQAINVNGVRKKGSRTEATLPINMEAAEQLSSSRIKITGNFDLNFGSNTDWQLYAKVKGLDRTKELLVQYGWNVRSFEINWKRESAELTEEIGEITKGDNGSFELEVSYQLLLNSKKGSGVKRPPLEDMENVLVFQIK